MLDQEATARKCKCEVEFMASCWKTASYGVGRASSERDNCLDGEWQKAPSECEYAMGQRAAGLLEGVVDSGEVTHQKS